jgi:AcrR family transcriptional regulator
VRERLVAAGTALVAEQGSGAVSLREIARRAGVSHGAPRRYFPTHQHLLAAIAREGYRELGALLAVADPGAQEEPRTRLVVLSRVFVDFASSRSGMFELMFRHDLLRGANTGLRQESLPLFRLLVDLVAGALWANLYGIAQLWQWESLQLATGSDDLLAMLSAAVDAHASVASSGAEPRARK